MATAVQAAPAASASSSDDLPLTSRTHDGTVNHDASGAAAVRPPSPSQSAYTPATTTTTAAATPAQQWKPASSAIVLHSTASSSSVAPPRPSTTNQPASSLARTQPLQARAPSSRPSTVSGIRPRPHQRLVASNAGANGDEEDDNDPTKKPFYKQELIEPDQSVVQPFSQQHMQSLPLSAALAHVSKANAEALEAMKRKQYQLAYERLKRAETFCQASVLKRDRSQASVTLRASTWNNLAILFKSVNRLRDALWYANRALRLEINFVPGMREDGTLTQRPNPAGTHLNMCAILSSLGRHGSALLHAECALSSLYLELHQLATQVAHAKRREAARQQQQDLHGTPSSSSPSSPSSLPTADRASILSLIAVAYHNAAVEQEFLKQYRAATHSYRRAHEFAAKRLGPQSTLARTIEHAYEGAVNLHPLKVTAREQSMDPHTNLTVTNPAAITASTQAAPHNKWLIPALANNRMTARHIPVRLVPWNQFVSVSGLPTGRQQGAGEAKHGRKQRQEEKESASDHHHQQQYSSFESPSHHHHQDDEDGPPITEEFLRQRIKQSAFPSHPPPQGVMNAEEDSSNPSGAGMQSFSHPSTAPPPEDAGYWSDPELSEVPTPGHTAGGPQDRGASGPAGGKTRQDPRNGPAVARLRGANGRGGGHGSRTTRGPASARLPASASEGKLDGATMGGQKWNGPPAQQQQQLQMRLQPPNPAYPYANVYMMPSADGQQPPYGYYPPLMPPLMPTQSPYQFQPQYVQPAYPPPPTGTYAQQYAR